MVTLGLSKTFLNLLINFVHFNAAYLDGEVLVGVVRYVGLVLMKTQTVKLIVGVVLYSYLIE